MKSAVPGLVRNQGPVCKQRKTVSIMNAQKINRKALTKIFHLLVDLSEWSEYSACSESCGPGKKTQTRECNTGVCCGAVLSMSDDCEDNEGNCQILIVFLHEKNA